MFTFAKCRYEDLKACDVEELLRQYKELYNIVERNARHKRIFDSSDGDADPVNKLQLILISFRLLLLFNFLNLLFNNIIIKKYSKIMFNNMRKYFEEEEKIKYSHIYKIINV